MPHMLHPLSPSPPPAEPGAGNAFLLPADAEAARPAEHGTNGHAGNGAERKRADSAVSSTLQDDGQGDPTALCNTNVPAASTASVMAPFRYLKSLPSKGVRERLIDALNIWIEASPESLDCIKSIVGDVHAISLMLDDVEDNSPLRRARPAAHSVFGSAQTINSANFQIVHVIGRAAALHDDAFLQALIGEMKSLLVGQSLDLHSTHTVAAPSVQEYLQTIDGKTGGLFRMVSKLMVIRSGAAHPPARLDRLMTLLGRYFQIRDDYLNLVSDAYCKAKGPCEDLDEGKYSLMVIHALSHAGPSSRALLGAMQQQRRATGCAGPGHKELILEILRDAGSLDYAAQVLRALGAELTREMGAVEASTGRANARLSELVRGLEV